MKKILIVFFITLLLLLGPFRKVEVSGEEEFVTPSPEATPTLETTPTIEPTPREEIFPTLTPESSLVSTLEPSPTPDPPPELNLNPTPEIDLPSPPENSIINEAESTSASLVQIEGEGTKFKLEKEGDTYIIKTSSPIKGLFELTTGGIVLNFETADDNQATIFTITGFLPNYVYHLYTDDFHNHREVVSDSEGNLVFTQDIASRHLLIIQPLPSTKYIKNDATGGDCLSIGSWNNTTKTCTLNKDVAETIQIDSSGVTLNGNGFKVNPAAGTTNGVYFKSGITGSKLINIKIYNSSYGVYFYQANNNSVENIFTSNNSNYGIYLYSSSGNNISNSTFEKATYGLQLYQSGNNTFTNNTFTNNTSQGVYIYNGSHLNNFFGK